MASTATLESSAITWSSFTKGYFQNPYPHLAACREHNPIHKGVIHNNWMFFRYDDVKKITKSNTSGVSDLRQYLEQVEKSVAFTGCPFLSKNVRKWPMYLNGEEHKIAQTLMAKSLNKLNINEIIEKSLEQTLSEFSNSASLDLVEWVSNFPFYVTTNIMGIQGIPNEALKRYSNFVARSQDMFVPKQVYVEMNDEFAKGEKWFSDLLSNPNKNKYIQSLIELGKDNQFSHADLTSILTITFMAAYETSKDSLSIALYEILKNQKLKEYVLEASDSEINVVVEEMFRFASPLQYTLRINLTPLTFGDIHIDTYSKLIVCLASANRDPSVFEAPDEFNPERRHNPHLAFGNGMHTCLGAKIARLEMRLALRPLIQKLKDYKIDDDYSPVYNKQIFMRTLESAIIKKK